MKAKKWHWRARASALYVSTQIPHDHSFEILFCTSVLPLAELLGLRPDLIRLKKLVYFHENQLEFPVRITKERDFQYGYNEILTCIVADKVLFNSYYNQDSFLSHINGHLNLQPDYRLKDLDQTIRPKCTVIYYPLDLYTIDYHLSSRDAICSSAGEETSDELHIVWPHRWEFDKNPEAFYKCLCKMDESGHMFKVSILGETFGKKMEVFNDLHERLTTKLVNLGYVSSPAKYYGILKTADVVVSTAIHEFFGVAVLEAVYCGCVPVVPNRLAYTELYGGRVEEIYETEEELYDILVNLCKRKKNDDLNKDYRYLALPYDAKKWFDKMYEVFNS
ncbi:glycosyltransferase-like domain-containing protein 1 isoform X2 [Pectinophora gossypiella]|nr:glycosyltransferase-like domain-containing protein 1 isoform X2 [Pectinophora gossypiella]XP_049885328.1 glycosyltransferase-like domain-containing protein 1 isoform X2 [Pectinophora gossypiella]